MPVLKRKPARKSLPVSGRDAVSSHSEVMSFLKSHLIRVAADLFCAAEEQSASGDHRLLAYCTGSGGGMKRGLQKIVDQTWAAEATVASAAESAATALGTELAEAIDGTPRDAGLAQAGTNIEVASPASHEKPLDATRLEELKHRARQAPTPQALLEPRQVQKRLRSSPLSNIAHAQGHMREVEKRTKTRNQKVMMVQDIVLFDSYDRRAEIVFFPRKGIWRLRDYYELLVACRVEEVLADMNPSQCGEGGFNIPRTEVGWHQLLRAGVAPVKVPFAELSPEQRAGVAAELRFGLGCGALQWRTPAPPTIGGLGASADLWIEHMPEDPAFEKDSLNLLVPEERLVRLWAHRHLEDRQMHAFVKVLEACGHHVQQTTGFQISRNASTESLFCVTGSRALSARHKTGAGKSIGFAFCALDLAESKGSPSRLSILGSASSRDDRPQLPRVGTQGATKLRALLATPMLMDIIDEGALRTPPRKQKKARTAESATNPSPKALLDSAATLTEACS